MKSAVVEILGLQYAVVREEEVFLRKKFEKGRLHNGVKVVCGPITWFESEEGSFWICIGEKCFEVSMEEILDILS
nr:hypothetical protein [Marseillevirus cajuinensis]